MDKLSVIGLGKLGCSMATCFAYKNFQVIGVDVLENSVKMLNMAMAPIFEPGLQELITDHQDNLRATTDTVEAILNTDASFIIVPTPSIKSGAFTTKYVKDVIKKVGVSLKQKNSYHLVVITSTILPGDTFKMEKILEKISGKRCGIDFGLCYNPDFIAIGNIIHDFLNPDMVLIGQSDPKSGLQLQKIHERLVNNNPEFHLMSYHNAELAKVALNSFCTMKITFANVIAEICENMPKGNAANVLGAIGADSRIGKKYFKGALAYSGPCFPRDNQAFFHTAERYNVKATLAETTDMLNDYYKHYRLSKLLNKALEKKKVKKVAFLGLTYKEDTTLVEEAAPVAAMQNLAKQDIEVTAYDPMGMPEAEKVLNGDKKNIRFAETVSDCLRGQSVCFVGTPWDEFKLIKKHDFLFHMVSDPLIIDAWDLYDFDGIDIIKIGVCSHDLDFKG